jgi:sialate O-acetylesterase
VLRSRTKENKVAKTVFFMEILHLIRNRPAKGSSQFTQPETGFHELKPRLSRFSFLSIPSFRSFCRGYSLREAIILTPVDEFWFWTHDLWKPVVNGGFVKIRLGFFFLLAVIPAFSEPVSLTVSRVFTDRAVLQRDQRVPVWGTITPAASVTVEFGETARSTTADGAGHWRVDLPPLPADAEGRDLTIRSSDGQEKTFTDIVVGDLWLCAGQSNMELGMAAIAERAQEVKDLKVPALRLYLVPKAASGTSRSEVFGAWVPSDRVSVTSGGWYGFSAVAYTFGRALQRSLDVPIGLIQTAYGGSPIHAWIPPSAWRKRPGLSGYADEAQRADETFEQARRQDPLARHPFDDPTDTRDLGPSSIWRAMLAPLGPLAFRGVVWYQGETDVGDGPLYTLKQKALIEAWRDEFGFPDLPFYFVQLAPWAGYGGQTLPEFWAAQEATLTTSGTGMVVTVDLGEADNIHPPNKRPVGERLALQALVHTYERPLVPDGPVVTDWSHRGEQIVVSWRATGNLMTTDGRPPQSFEVRDPSGWRSALATLEGVTVVLHEVPGATAVRYAWSSFPSVNLSDASGLPARPFLR